MNEQQYPGVDLHYVTHDPRLLETLRAKECELDSHGLAEYAYSLGLYPPGYTKGVTYGIITAWPPEATPDSEGVLLWNTSDLGEGDQTDEPEDYSEGEDPWAGIVPVTRVPENRDD